MFLKVVILLVGFLFLVKGGAGEYREEARDSAAYHRSDDCSDGNEYAGGGG